MGTLKKIGQTLAIGTSVVQAGTAAGLGGAEPVKLTSMSLLERVASAGELL
jgi:hypothetical protein